MKNTNRKSKMSNLKSLFVATLCLCAAGNNASGQVTTIDSGSCGANLTWVLTSDSLLTISGSGAMNDYSYSGGSVGSPWYSSYQDDIKTIVIENVHIVKRLFYVNRESPYSIQTCNRTGAHKK